MDNTVYIGDKPFMNYVNGVVLQLTKEDRDEVIISGRGEFITRAVDVAEVVTKRFLEDTAAVADITIGSDEFENDDGEEIRVSTIDITVEQMD